MHSLKIERQGSTNLVVQESLNGQPAGLRAVSILIVPHVGMKCLILKSDKYATITKSTGRPTGVSLSHFGRSYAVNVLLLFLFLWTRIRIWKKINGEFAKRK